MSSFVWGVLYIWGVRNMMGIPMPSQLGVTVCVSPVRSGHDSTFARWSGNFRCPASPGTANRKRWSTYLLPKKCRKTLVSTCFHPSHKNSQKWHFFYISTIQTKTSRWQPLTHEISEYISPYITDTSLRAQGPQELPSKVPWQVAQLEFNAIHRFGRERAETRRKARRKAWRGRFFWLLVVAPPHDPQHVVVEL